MMKRSLLALAAVTMLSQGAFAAKIGVTMDKFDDNFLTVLRNGMTDYAKKNKIDLQVLDAKDDLGTQISQVQNFIANKVDAIIVNAVDTSATPKMTALAVAAHIPLVYVNRKPADKVLPAGVAYVGSDEKQSGTMETQAMCKLMGGKGNIVVMEGELSNEAAVTRTKDIHNVLATKACSGIHILREQSANWDRTKANDLMTNWISAGVKPDAVIANNDEMAIGAIQALTTAGMTKVKVSGIDGTQDGLAQMKAGRLQVSVFQNAAAQGSGAIKTALKLIAHKKVASTVWVPFELITPANMAKYMAKN